MTITTETFYTVDFGTEVRSFRTREAAQKAIRDEKEWAFFVGGQTIYDRVICTVTETLSL